MDDPKTNSILDEGNRLFLKGKYKEAISYYDKILNEKLNKIKTRARNYVVQNFNFDKILEMELNLYEEVLNLG